MPMNKPVFHRMGPIFFALHLGGDIDFSFVSAIDISGEFWKRQSVRNMEIHIFNPDFFPPKNNAHTHMMHTALELHLKQALNKRKEVHPSGEAQSSKLFT